MQRRPLSQAGIHERLIHSQVAQDMFGQDDSLAVRVGRYLVLDVIGSGGMGTVYLAYDPKLERRVALKVLRAGTVNGDAAKARLRREAIALASLSHPHVVAIHEVGELGGEVFLAMEYIEGSNLAEWSQGDVPRRPGEALRYIVEVARGLAAAHRKGLVHRDVKPANILIGDEGRARIADFGLVQQHGFHSSDAESGRRHDATSDERMSSTTGMRAGTPRYASPEQRAGRRVDAKSDQFSLCVTAWEVLFGDVPWPGQPAGDEPPAAPPGQPTWLVEVLRVGLRVAPTQRYPSLEVLIEALSNDPTQRRRRRRLAAAGAAAIGIAVAATMQYRALRCEQGDAPTGTTAEQLDPAARAAVAAYAHQWRTTSRAVCHADDGAAAVARGCLQMAKAGLLGVVAAGGHGAQSTVGLPWPGDCSTATTTWALPTADAEGVLSAYRNVSQARALRARGEEAEARAAYARVPSLDEHSITALRVAALRFQAETARRDEDLATATALTLQAYEIALEGGDFPAAAELATSLRSLNASLHKDAAAELWRRQASLLSQSRRAP